MPKIIENINEKILQEGRKILLSKNYRELNIRDIVKNCNIGIGTFYNYFSSKEELVINIFKEDWENSLLLINKLKFSFTPLKDKLYKIYLCLEEFLDKYISIFYEIAMLNGYSHNSSHNFNDINKEVSELIDFERKRGNISSSLSSIKIANLIVSNFVYLSKNKYMTFDELYGCLKL
ncbi:TetR/AcrR family transcriptional regulator [Clostridium rectalis]|uniref:TetR/AcrR family transcriptional regulator n=1 Tax=Clostridium rectalis TaxID=2040295 RepID=UPI000F638255|nr:TetR/AcrR family transcriptional regulator [Clostridium rectalis]